MRTCRWTTIRRRARGRRVYEKRRTHESGSRRDPGTNMANWLKAMHRRNVHQSASWHDGSALRASISTRSITSVGISSSYFLFSFSISRSSQKRGSHDFAIISSRCSTTSLFIVRNLRVKIRDPSCRPTTTRVFPSLSYEHLKVTGKIRNVGAWRQERTYCC